MLQNALVSWFYPSQQISTTQSAALSLPRQCEKGRIGKVSKLMGWNKENLKDKVQATHNQNKTGIHLPLPMGRQFIRVQESRAPSWIMVTWWHRGHPTSFLLLSPALCAEQSAMGYPFGQLGSAVPAMGPPNSLCTPTSSLVVWYEKQERPSLCVSTAQSN